MKLPLAFVAATSSFLLAIALVAACSAGDDAGAPEPMASSDASFDRARLSSPLRPDASCPVVIDSPPLRDGLHVAQGSPLSYETNPPSSGPHYPMWASFQEFEEPVHRGFWLHSAEHGGIVLLYKCEGASCGPIREGLRKVRDELASDPRCDPSIRVRVVISPDPELDVPVAAVAWGWTYKADCLDLPTLQAFARDHYAAGPEDICGPGRSTF